MNIVLWILQILLALHTLTGAIWKFTNSEQRVDSLNAIPHGVWQGLSIVEILCAAGLILPLLVKRLRRLAPWSAVAIGVEMLFFCMVFLVSGAQSYGELIYWLVVAAICGVIAYGRWAIKPM
ncbi:MAG: DoxX family protein [Saprospiraceae bacterium]